LGCASGPDSAAAAWLWNIAAVPITDKEAKALTGLGKHRNKLQHFGLTAPARAVEAKAGEVLDFLSASSTRSSCSVLALRRGRRPSERCAGCVEAWPTSTPS
jgi:hypothetical protein